jgi:hypothetical protein
MSVQPPVNGGGSRRRRGGLLTLLLFILLLIALALLIALLRPDLVPAELLSNLPFDLPILGATSPPTAPSNIQGYVIALYDVPLSWRDNSDDEDGFWVYRQRTDTGEPLIFVGGSRENQPAFLDISTTCGATYRYVVASYNEAGESPTTECWEIALPECPPTQSTNLHSGPEASINMLTGSSGLDGDFYWAFGPNGSPLLMADLAGQFGVADLGQVSDVPLYDVPVPHGAYTLTGVPAVQGNTYAAWARDGMSMMVFTIKSLGDFVSLDYIVYWPGEAILSACDPLTIPAGVARGNGRTPPPGDGDRPGLCGAPCGDDSQCAAGLSCDGGQCWSPPLCGTVCGSPCAIFASVGGGGGPPPESVRGTCAPGLACIGGVCSGPYGADCLPQTCWDSCEPLSSGACGPGLSCECKIPGVSGCVCYAYGGVCSGGCDSPCSSDAMCPSGLLCDLGTFTCTSPACEPLGCDVPCTEDSQCGFGFTCQATEYGDTRCRGAGCQPGQDCDEPCGEGYPCNTGLTCDPVTHTCGGPTCGDNTCDETCSTSDDCASGLTCIWKDGAARCWGPPCVGECGHSCMTDAECGPGLFCNMGVSVGVCLPVDGSQCGPTGPSGPSGPTGPSGPCIANPYDNVCCVAAGENYINDPMECCPAGTAATGCGPSGPTGPSGPSGPCTLNPNDGICCEMENGGNDPACPAPNCESPCMTTSQCGTAPDGTPLICAGGICWDACACGGDCGDDGDEPGGPSGTRTCCDPQYPGSCVPIPCP